MVDISTSIEGHRIGCPSRDEPMHQACVVADDGSILRRIDGANMTTQITLCEICRERPAEPFKASDGLCTDCLVSTLHAENDRLDNNIAVLEAENERLRLLGTAESISKGIAESSVERLRAFVQKVALYSNDAWLAREADELAPGASL
jgi:hypothetical protein